MKGAILVVLIAVVLASCGVNYYNEAKNLKEHVTESKPRKEVEKSKKPKLIELTPTTHMHFVDSRKDPNLVWEDDFDSLDERHWNLLNYGYKDHGRLSYHLSKNDQISNGIMSLNIQKEQYKDFPYTTGAITTLNKIHFKYGKIFVRAKLPKGKGLMPAIWMLPADGKSFPEIDIAEIIGQEPRQLWNVVHWEENGEKRRVYNLTKTQADLTESYHIYGLEWTKDKMVWTLDGVKTCESDYSPQTDMYLYISTTVGGVWSGNPLPNQEFPQALCVDYVKYYKQ